MGSGCSWMLLDLPWEPAGSGDCTQSITSTYTWRLSASTLLRMCCIPPGTMAVFWGERGCFTELCLHHAWCNGVLGKAPRCCGCEGGGKMRLSVGDAERGEVCPP